MPQVTVGGQAGLLGSQLALSSLAGRAIGVTAGQSVSTMSTRTIGATAPWSLRTEPAPDVAGAVTIIVIPPNG